MYRIKLNELRVKEGLLEDDIALIFGVSQATYSRWETGVETMPLLKFNYLCNHFKVSMDYMIGRSTSNTFVKEHELDKVEIGKNLKQFREDNDLSQVELADFLKTTHSTISAYERGKTLILTAFLLDICNKYNVSMDEMCGRL